MAAPVYATSDVIMWAKITQYLANKDIYKNRKISYGSYDERLTRLLKIVRYAVEWCNTYFPNDANLPAATNYLFTLIGKYQFKAKEILDAQDGGIIVDPNTGLQVALQWFHQEFTVGQVGSPLVQGDIFYIIPIQNVIPNSVTLEMPQDNIPQGQTDQFSYNIAYTPTQVTIQFLNDAGSGNMGVMNGMLFIIRGTYTVIV